MFDEDWRDLKSRMRAVKTAEQVTRSRTKPPRVPYFSETLCTLCNPKVTGAGATPFPPTSSSRLALGRRSAATGHRVWSLGL